MGRLAPAVLTLLLALSGSAWADERSLEQRLTPLARAHKGTVAIGIKNLATGETFWLNADEALPTASLIKFPLMIEVYQQVLEGRLKLSDMVTLRDEDKVPGSGILTYHFSDGATFSLRDAVRLMIVFSDNTATNLVLDKIGIPSANKRMDGWGFPNTRIHAKVFKGSTTSIDPERTKRFGLGSTTAREMVGLLEKLHAEQIVNPESCKQMLEHLKKCDDKTKLKRMLPTGVVVAHKSGSVSDVKTDAGIIYLPKGRAFAICVLTAQNADKRFADDNAASVFIGRVAREAYDYFAIKGKEK